MKYTPLIWPLLDAKRMRRMLTVDPIIRLDLLLEAMDL